MPRLGRYGLIVRREFLVSLFVPYEERKDPESNFLLVVESRFDRSMCDVLNPHY